MSRLLSITWLLDSPFGDYLSGDYIEVYWDNENNIFIVYKNAIQIFSGAEIPFQSWTYASLPDTDYKEELPYQNSICNGVDLLNFSRKAQFPYLAYTAILNHPACVVVDPDDPIVCDLSYTSLPVVSNATSDTAFDGSITVVASGSNGAVKYRINSDFEFNDGTGQTSGTFSGLPKGNYLIYARDAINCIAVISVTIGVTVSYGVLYRIEYYDNRLGAHHKTEILQRDFSGSAIEIKASSEPTIYSLRGEGEIDKFIPVLSGQMVLEMIAETNEQFRELYTNDPDEYRMQHSIDTGGGYQIVWIGKLLPQLFEEDYKSNPYTISALASDGLASLNELYLLDDIGNRLTGHIKQITLIAWILNKIGLGINIRSGCNIYATGMNTAATDDPLDQAYVDVERYYLLSPSPTCWDVLKYILEPYGTQIILWYNVWNIVRVEERVAPYDYREYDFNGNYVSNGSYNPIKDLKNSTFSDRMVWKDQNQILKINPGYGNLRLLYNMGLKTNLVINGDFGVKNYSTFQSNVGGNLELVKGSIVDLTGFQVVNNNCIITTGTEYLEAGNVALEVTCNNHPSSTFSAAVPYEAVGFLLSDIQTLKMGNTDSLRIVYRVKITPLSPTPAYWVKARIQVRFGDYYLTSGGEWSLDISEIRFYVEKSQFNSFQEFELISQVFPDNTYLSGQPFFITCYFSSYYDTQYTTIAQLKTKATVDLEPGEREEVGELDSNYKYYELEESTATDNDDSIVRPSDYNASTNAVQWIRKSNVGTTRLTAPPAGVKLSIDKIQIEYLNNFKSLPEVSAYTQPMENKNRLNLDKTIFHGSLIDNGKTTTIHHERDFSPRGSSGPTYIISYDDVFFKANSANITYAGYLRNSSGVGYTTWSRDAVNELKELEKIYIDMITAQYNKPWFSIHGPFTGDLIFTPLDVLNETMDNDRKYYPVSLQIDFKRNFYEAQFLELTDVTDSEGEGISAGFTTGFSLGLRS